MHRSVVALDDVGGTRQLGTRLVEPPEEHERLREPVAPACLIDIVLAVLRCGGHDELFEKRDCLGVLVARHREVAALTGEQPDEERRTTCPHDGRLGDDE